jgi:HEAT repeat protein
MNKPGTLPPGAGLPSALIFLLIVAAPSAFAPISAPASLLQLQQNADLIVVGSASGGDQAGDILNFTIQVSRVLRGDVMAGTPIPVSWQSSPAVAATGHGLWFLNRSSGGWRVLPVQPGWAQFNDIFVAVPIGPLPTPYAYDPAAALSDKVASEISAAIESGTGRRLWPSMLDELNSPVTQVLYRRLSTSISAQQRILGLSGQIRSGSAEALTSAIQAAPALSGSGAEYAILLLSIRDEFRASDAKSVAIMGQAALNNNLNSDFRESAAHALRAIHTQDALPYLAALLDDPDIKLQEEAIGGLASFANGLPIQTAASVPSLAYLQLPDHAPYKTESTVGHFVMGPGAIAQLPFWKSWWAQNRVALGY